TITRIKTLESWRMSHKTGSVAKAELRYVTVFRKCMNRKFILARKNMKHNNAIDEENDTSDDDNAIPDMPRDEDFDIYDDPLPIDKKGKKKKSNDDDDGVYYDTEPWDA